MSSPHASEPIEVFCSYSHKDEELLEGLREQLAELKRRKVIVEWHDREIGSGKEWEGEIRNHLESASVILLLLSPSFLASDYCNDVEMGRALERHEAGEARVIPVILRPCLWQRPPLSKLKAVPRDGLPVTKWENIDDAFVAIAEAIQATVKELNESRQAAGEGRRAAAAPPFQTAEPLPPDKCFNNLPTQLTPFIGRRDELEDIKNLLREEEVRVVVIHGIGGAGKSRLAQQAVADLSREFKNGVCLVLLDRIADPDLVIATIAQTLGVREVAGLPVEERLKQYLRDRQMLLLLDNFEHLRPAARHVVDLLGACPRVKMLLTSQVRLNISGFVHYRMPPLRLPRRRDYRDADALSQYDAVQLFISRARAVEKFEITNETAPAVAEICVRLDGLPLAIVLAAARIAMLPPNEMLKRLEHQLDFLVRGRAGWEKRHETMRGTIAWSYDLLEEAGEKTLFKRISVFKNGCTLEAAEQVCDATGDLGAPLTEALVESLLEYNLLWRDEGAGGRPRFRMPEMIREYGLERLAEDKEEEASIRRQHAYYFLDLAEEAEEKITSAERGDWLEQLEDEHANFQTALIWSQTPAGEAEVGLRLAGALFWFWNLRAHFSDGRAWLEGALSKNKAAGQTFALAKALYGAGGLAFLQGDYSAARLRLEESVAVWRGLKEERRLAYGLVILGMATLNLGDFETALSSETEAVQIFRRVKDRWGCALSLNDLGNVYRLEGKYDEALRHYNQSLEIWSEMGDNWGLPLTLSNLGFLDLLSGKYATARRSLRRALKIQRKLDDKLGLAATLKHLGDLSVRQAGKRSDPARRRSAHLDAAKYYSESLKLNRDLGHKQFMVAALAGLTTVVGKIGQPDQAAELFGATDSLRRAYAVPDKDIDLEMYDSTLGDVRARFKSARAYERARARGQRMDVDHTIVYALELAPTA